MIIRSNCVQFKEFNQPHHVKSIPAATLWERMQELFKRCRLIKLNDDDGNQIQVNFQNLRNLAWSNLSHGLNTDQRNILRSWIYIKTPQELAQMCQMGDLQLQFRAYLEEPLYLRLLNNLNQILDQANNETEPYWKGVAPPVFHKQTLMNFILKLLDITEGVFDSSTNQETELIIQDLRKGLQEYKENKATHFSKEFFGLKSLNTFLAMLKDKSSIDISDEDKNFLVKFIQYAYPDLFPELQRPSAPPLIPKKTKLWELTQQLSEMIEDDWIDYVEMNRENKFLDKEANQALNWAIDKMKTVIILFHEVDEKQLFFQSLIYEVLIKIETLSIRLAHFNYDPDFNDRLKAKKYQFKTNLGFGREGFVFLVNKEGKEFALKKFFSPHITPRNLWWKYKFKESNLFKVHDSNVSRITDVIYAADGIAGVIMEYIKGKPLFDHASNGIPVQKIKKFARGILLGLKALHDEGIIHHDLKLENVMVDDQDHCILIDFGFSRNAAKLGPIKQSMGSIDYAGPELMTEGSHGSEVDLFAFGVLLFTLYAGRFPHRSHPSYAVSDKFSSILDDDARDLLEKLLKSAPSDRPNVDEVLAHPYFAKP